MKFNKRQNIASRSMGLFLMFSAAMAFNACSTDEEAFFTAEEGDSPRILNTDIPEWSNGEPSVLNTITLPNPFKFKVIATPIHYTKIQWFLDDELIHEGDSINQQVLAGNYLLKIVATTTKGLSTSRTCRLVVNPQDGDPQMGTSENELIVAPKVVSTVTGCKNLETVTKMYIGGKEVTNLKVDGTSISFAAPELEDGVYRVVLENAKGDKFGGNKMIVASNPVVFGNAVRLVGGSVTLTGINLDKVASLKVDNKDVTIAKQSANSLTFNYGDIKGGEYAFTGKDKSGNAIKFAVAGALTDKATATMPEETTIWEGSQNIDWNLFQGGAEQFQAVAAAGTKLYIYCKINAGDYHQLRFMDAGWSNLWPEYKDDYHWDGNNGDECKLEIELSQADADIVKAHGFAISGHGVEITKIAYK